MSIVRNRDYPVILGILGFRNHIWIEKEGKPVGGKFEYAADVSPKTFAQHVATITDKGHSGVRRIPVI